MRKQRSKTEDNPRGISQSPDSGSEPLAEALAPARFRRPASESKAATMARGSRSRRASEYARAPQRDMKPWADTMEGAGANVQRGATASIVMSQYALGSIAEQCVRFGEYETGGELYGLFTRGRRPVIFLATGPGPKAVHGLANYRLDIDFCRQSERVLAEKCGLQSNGTWHTHAGMGLWHPSGGDETRTASFMDDNGHIERWIELIVTHRSLRDTSTLGGWWKKPQAVPDGEREVRIDAFEFTADGQHERVAIRVLRGTPPFLLPLLADPDLAFLGAGMHAGTFPANRILIDEVEADAAPSAQSVLPEPIREQLMGLANEVGDEVELTLGPDGVVVELPLEAGRTAHIAVSARPPHLVESVQIEEGDSLATLPGTAWRGRGGTALPQVYARLAAQRRSPQARKPRTKEPSGLARLWPL